jgi:hypothetical protein
MTVRRPLAVVIGSIGKLPYAGMSLYFLHYVAGLQQLGYSVHYVETQKRPLEYYDPRTQAMTDDLSTAITYLGNLETTFGVAPEAFTVLDRRGDAHGADRGVLRRALRQADVVLAVADRSWFEDLDLCAQRAFVDGDPMLTQAAMLDDAATAQAIARYPVLFSYGTRIGRPDCAIPTCDRTWLPTRPVVATDLWTASPATPGLPVSALLHWRAGSDVVVGGKTYGHKDREFARFVNLPARTDQEFVLAVGGSEAPRAKLRAAGWNLVDPLAATADLRAYRAFIAGSKCDFGVAKHAYVASRSGWFSDRATCFLAAGRPVLHQDTGFGAWLPESRGVAVFSDVGDAAEALARLDRDYEGHAAGARQIAERFFEARDVIAQMFAAAGFGRSPRTAARSRQT